MIYDYGIKPLEGHLVTMTTLMGRDGNLEGAYEFVMDNNPTPNMFSALLAECEVHGNIRLGKVAYRELEERGALTGGLVNKLINL